jgi:Flp pilus assembly protein protease CpaA
MTTMLVVRLGLSIVLVGLGVYDLWRARVPNLVVLPLLVTTIPLTAIRLTAGDMSLGQVGLIVTTWAVCLCLWSLHIFGGGDMKLVMALVGLFPALEFVLLLSGSVLIGLLVVLACQSGRAGLLRLRALLVTAASGSLPTRSEIRAAYATRPSRVTFLISLAACGYLWLASWI